MELSSASRIVVVAVFALHAGAHAAAAVDLIFADGFEACAAGATRACYGGPVDTEDIGVCQAGVQYCVSGTWGPCTAERTPVFESCNGLDDDCNGFADDGLGTITCGFGACQQTVPACAGGDPGTCTPGPATAEGCDGIDNDCDGAIDEDGCNCVHVAPTGMDANPGTATLPKRTIGAAISAAGTMGLPNVVCVAGASTCAAAPSTFDYPEAVTMRNGVHVYGGYSPVGLTWPRAAGCRTRIVDQDPRGVYFDATVTATTILDGFTIVGKNLLTNAAVTVEGSTGAVINNDVVNGGNGTTSSYGVNVIDSAGTAATPTISNNGITGGGNGTALAVGVRSLNSAPVIRGNCNSVDASGRCSADCTAPRFIVGKPTFSGGAESYGVRLEASPGAVVDQNGICSNGNNTMNAAGVRLSGDATGTVIRANNIFASNIGPLGSFVVNAVGVWADPCAGASPWVVNNFIGSSATTGAFTRSDGIRAVGSCHVRIDHNLQISGGGVLSQPGDAAESTGVFCARDVGSGVASRCTILGNGAIVGSVGGSIRPTSIGIRCDDGACAIIQNNGLISGGRAGRAQTAIGVALGQTGTFVDANVIQGECATSVGIGLSSNDSFARIQNNQISGVTSPNGCFSLTLSASIAVSATVDVGANEIDLNSNDLFAEGSPGLCTSVGISFGASAGTPATLAPRGIVRNNIVFAGKCNTSFAVFETSTKADPRMLQNNDLWQNAAVTALYRDEGSTNLTTISSVNALSDITASGNISADPLYTTGHLSSASPCRDAGFLTGAPPFDFEGDPRPAGPACDIGRDEFTPTP